MTIHMHMHDDPTKYQREREEYASVLREGRIIIVKKNTLDKGLFDVEIFSADKVATHHFFKMLHKSSR